MLYRHTKPLVFCSWTSPDGTEYFVKYVADRFGYRVVESNAVPVTGTGVRANGRQVSFESNEAESHEFRSREFRSREFQSREFQSREFQSREFDD
ncbi:uncharacterized protein LOC143017606 [Oratosquilla oratoria]|uniref:uncharacterized protein LOC143017606 n=1 Tax=Oratosquilla oratoria TaxID=337810 RepID=UPI003F77564F